MSQKVAEHEASDEQWGYKTYCFECDTPLRQKLGFHRPRLYCSDRCRQRASRRRRNVSQKVAENP
jgi:hypothetical protein